MKKKMMCLCAGVLVFSLAACGKGGEEESGSQDSAISSEASDSAEETTVENSSAEDSSEEVPAVPEEGMQGWSEEMEGLKQAVVEALGADNYWPDMAMDAEMLEVFFGISSDMYEDFMAESPMVSTNVDTLVIVKAKEDTVEAVETALNGYREAKVNDTMQYPMNIGKIQASQVEKIGNYVIFVQLGGFAVEADEEAEALAQCQEANQLALDTIRSRLEEGGSGN